MVHDGKGWPLEEKGRYDKKLLLILEGASRIFAEKGYHNASIRDIAAATGVSPAGLYYYFSSKEELLHLIIENSLSSLVARIREEVADIPDPGVRLRTIIKIHLEQFQNSGQEMRVLVREWGSLSGAFGVEIRGLMRQLVRIATRTLSELAPEKGPKELRSAAFGLFGMLTWVHQWYRPGRDLPLELLADEFSSIFLGGIQSHVDPSLGAKTTEGKDTTLEWSKQNSASSILSGPGF